MSLLYSEVLRSGLELAEFFKQSKLILSSNSTGIIPMDRGYISLLLSFTCKCGRRRGERPSNSPTVPATGRQESGMGPHGNKAGLLEIPNQHVGCCQGSFFLHLLLFLSLTPFCKYASLSSWSIVARIPRELYVTAPVTNAGLT